MSDRYDEMALSLMTEVANRGLNCSFSAGAATEMARLVAALVRRAVDDAYLTCADMVRECESALVRDSAFTLRSDVAAIQRHMKALHAAIVYKTTAIRARGEKPVVGDACPQCGECFDGDACGPTHAFVANERKQAAKEGR